MPHFKIKKFDKAVFSRDYFCDIGEYIGGFNVQVFGSISKKELRENPNNKFFQVVIQSVNDYIILDDDVMQGLSDLLTEVSSHIFGSVGLTVHENVEVYYLKSFENENSFARAILDEYIVNKIVNFRKEHSLPYSWANEAI